MVVRFKYNWPLIIIAIATLLIIVISIFAYYSYIAAERASLNEFNQRQLVLARGSKKGIELFFEHLAEEAISIGKTIEVQKFEEKPSRQRIKRRYEETKHIGIIDIGLIDANGRLRFNVTNYYAEGKDFSSSEDFKETKNLSLSRNSFIVKFIEKKNAQKGFRDLIIAVPVYNDGKFLGAVVYYLKMDTVINEFVASAKSSKNGSAFLIDKRLNVVWSPDKSQIGINLLKTSNKFPSFKKTLKKMASGRSGEEEYSYFKFNKKLGFTDEKEEYLIAFNPVRVGKEIWSIGVWAPKTDGTVLVRGVFIRQVSLFSFVVLIVVAIAALALSISFRISKVLQKEVELKTKDLMVSEEKYRSLVNNVNIGVYRNTGGPQGKFLEANPAIAKMLGYDSVDEFMKISVADFYKNPENRKLFIDEITKKGSVKNKELFVRRKDDRLIWISVTANAKFDSKGNIEWIDGVLEDITERKRSEDLGNSLTRINVDINSTLDIDKILRRVVKDSTKAIGAESGGITMREGKCWIGKYFYKMPKEVYGMRNSDKQAPHAALAAKLKKPVVIKDTFEDSRVNVELMKKYGLRSLLVVPLIVREEVIGVLGYNYKSAPKGFDEIQVDFAIKLGVIVSLAIENARLYSVERDISNTLQEALLTIPKKIEGIEFGYLYRSATETAKVGGDFYDLFELEEHRVGIIIGDVSGKGIEAATLTSLVKDTIRAYAYQESSPASIVQKTNDVVVKTTLPGVFVTAFFGILDTKTGHLIFCSGGHPNAILKKRKTSQVSLLPTRSPAIGVFYEQEYFDDFEKLEEGDFLIMYSDGVTEARNDREMFGEERLIDLIKKLESDSVMEYPKTIFDQVKKYAHGKLRDDIVLLAISLGNR